MHVLLISGDRSELFIKPAVNFAKLFFFNACCKHRCRLLFLHLSQES